MIPISYANFELQEHFKNNFEEFGGKKIINDRLNNKLMNTYGILSCMQRIMFYDDELKLLEKGEKEMMEILALWHDIGRFYQVNKDGLIKNDIFNHGKVGFNILLNRFPDTEYYPILLALKYHNKKKIDGLKEDKLFLEMPKNKQKLCIIMAKAIMDVSKIQNLENIMFSKGKIMEKYIGLVGKDTKNKNPCEINPEFIEKYIKKELINKKTIKNISEYYLIYLSREYHFYFEGAKKMFNFEKLKELIKEKLLLNGVKEKIIKNIGL